MEPQEYLEKILKGQDLGDDSKELKDLQNRRKDVEQLLRNGFPDAKLTIRYGGSKAKGSLIRESYDVDIVAYVPHDNDEAGETLKDIFHNMKDKLAEDYYVEPKRSALRLRDKENKLDFFIDVVPGRYVDDSKSDCFLYQNGAEKNRLKTNLDVHVSHVKDSGVVPAIRLLKLWKVRRGLQIKQFVFELLVIDLLKGKKDRTLPTQLKHVWTELRDAEEPMSVEDPANPSGNDLSELVKDGWYELSSRSRDTLDLLERDGWEAIFGEIDEGDNGDGNTENLKRAAAAIATPTKAWFDENA